MARTRAEFHMIDVGQGSFCVWTTPQTDIIIDANIPVDGPHVKTYLLQQANVTSPVNLFLVTGWDRDHAHPMGVGMVTRNFSVDRVWIPQWPNDTGSAQTVRSLLKEARWTNSYNVEHPRTDRTRSYTINDTTVTIFSPHPEDANSSNNCSIVARLEAHGFSVLVTGDCEADRWKSIVRFFGRELESDVLVAPHHGARNGVYEPALASIAPKLVLVSAGDNAQYGHPHAEAIKAYRGVVGEDICVTKTHGHIRAWKERGRVTYAWDGKQ